MEIMFRALEQAWGEGLGLETSDADSEQSQSSDGQIQGSEDNMGNKATQNDKTNTSCDPQ
jgi:hypothetical protein